MAYVTTNIFHTSIIQLMEQHFKGFIKLDNYREAFDIAYIGEDCLISIMEEFDGKTIQVSYYISDKEKSQQEFLQDSIINLSGGIADTEYEDCYNETTGYLWSNYKAEVGGHDLLTEIGDHAGKYIFLIVRY